MKIINILKLTLVEFKKIASNARYKDLIQKKMRFLMEATVIKEANVNNMFLIDYDEKLSIDNENICKLLEEIECEYVEVKTHSSVFQVTKKELKQLLLTLKINAVLLIRDFIHTEYCGYAWITRKEHLYVEVRKGGFNGFWNMEGIPSYYLVNKDGKILYEKINSAGYYEYNYEKKILGKSKGKFCSYLN